MQLDKLIQAQQQFFLSGATKDLAFRRKQLEHLLAAIKAHESQIMAALKQDLGKPDMESYGGEVGFVYQEIRHTLRSLGHWGRPRSVSTPIVLRPSRSFIMPEPYGRVLIMGPWNYPFNLLIAPLVGAIAAGNCVVLKPSEWAPHTAKAVEQLITEAFPAHYVAVVQGDADVAQSLLTRQWDYIFFTGSTRVGRAVARAAAEYLTPVTLELGGKSPCIVDRETDLTTSARRIVWGKYFNAGQTCVAPDYLLVHRAVKEPLLQHMQKAINAFFGPDPAASEDYARIINDRHFDRLQAMLSDGRAVAGGVADRSKRYIAPTILDDVPLTAGVMQEEIFGPILPVLTFDDLDAALAIVRRFPKPLSLYLFTTSRVTEQRVLTELSFGGGCINDTLVHLSNPALPFGGVGESGLGRYHGHFSFDTFSHLKGIVRSGFTLDPKVRYQPYRGKLRLARWLLK